MSVFCMNSMSQDIATPIIPSLPTTETSEFHENNQFGILPDSIIDFKDNGLKFYCLQAADRNHDGEVSYNEAAMTHELNCEYGGRRSLRYITSYDDLIYFVNLEKLFLGVSNIKELDLSANKKLKLVNMNALDMLESIVLSKNCSPEIVYPLSKQDTGVKIIY